MKYQDIKFSGILKKSEFMLIFIFLFWVFMLMQRPLVASALTTGQENIVARADYYYNTKWRVETTVRGWRNKNIFYAGETHHIPYGQPISAGRYIGWGVSMDKFLESTRNPDSVFYQSRSVNNYDTGSYSTFYATDCSAFASYCWNLPQRTTTGTFPSLNVKSYGKCIEENIPNIQVGDVLNKAYSHVVVVTDINYYEDASIASIEITEQTVPEMKRSCYSVTQLEARFGDYTIYRYVKRESVTPPPASSNENWYDVMETADLGEVFYARLKLHSGEFYVTVSENSILSRQLDSENYEQQIWKFERQTNGSYLISTISDSFASSGNCVMTLTGEWLGMYGAEIQLDRKQIGIQQNYKIYQDSDKNCYYIRPESTDLPISLNRMIYAPNRDDLENPDEIADFIINFEDSLMLSRFEPDSENIQFDILPLDIDHIFLEGDVNLDGTVDVLDVIMLQKWLLQTDDLTCWKNADLHRDQQIDIFDLVTLKYQLIHSVTN